MKTNSNANLAYVKLEQWLDGKWQRPSGYTSDVYYALVWEDANHAKIYPRPVAGTYTNTLDDLETGRYAFHFVKQYLYDSDGLNNQDVYLGSYYILGATEASILNQTPPANGALRASDWEDLVFEFSKDMAPGDSDLRLLIKDPSGNVVREFAPYDILWDGDNTSARIHLDPAIVRGSEEVVYTVEMPRGFMKQASGSELPTAENTFTITVGRYVEIEGNYPKYSVSPDPKAVTAQTSLGTFVFTYYGADAVELGTDLPEFLTNGVSKGGDVTVTVGKTADDFPTVTVKFKTGVSVPAIGTRYALVVPRLAWTVTRGDHVYSTQENIVYERGGGTNVTSATVQSSVISSSTTTISYNDKTDSEYSKAQAVEAFSSVTINPGNNRNVKTGSGNATLKKASDNSVVATYTNPATVASVSTAQYTATLSEDMFEAGQTYYWELPTNAILGYSNKEMAKALKVYFTILSDAAAPTLYDIHVANTAGKPRVRLDHIDFECATDGETYGFAMSRATGGEAPYIGDENGNKLTVTDDDGNVSNKYMLIPSTHKGNLLTYKVSPTIIEQGKYTIVVPEKAFAIDGSDFNKALQHPFEIKDNHAEWSIPIYEQISTRDGIEGADDHPMKGFSRITLSFPEDIDIQLNDQKKPVVFHKVWEETSGNDTYEKDEESESKISMTAEGNEVYIDFTPALTTDGTYRLRIPAETILMMGAFDEYVAVTGYLAYFRIQDSTAATVEPKIGSTVTELSDITFTFTKAQEVLADTNPSAPAGLYDADMNELEGYRLSVRTEGNKGIISINPALDVDGTYTIIVPEGRFRCKANASAEEEEVMEYRISYTVVDPSDPTPSINANSVMSSLEKVEFEFFKAVNVDLTPDAKASIKDAAGNVLSDYTVALTMDKDYYSDRIILAEIQPAITTTGKYSLVLDANSAACYREWNGDKRNNEEYVLPFEIKNPTDSRVSPSSGSGRAMSELSKVTVTYANAAKVERGSGAVTLLAEDGVTPLEGYTVEAAAASDNTGTITISPAITKSGTYKIKVEAGTFLCMLSENDAEGVESRERMLTYIVQDPTVITSIDPADGKEDMEKLDRITFTFANDITITATTTPEVTVEDEDGNNVIEDEDIEVSFRINGNQARIVFDPAITTPGYLTVTVPAGTFSAMLATDERAVEVEEQELTYSIKPGLYEGSVEFAHESGDEIPATLERVFITFPEAEYVAINNDVEDPITLTHDTSVKVNGPQEARAMAASVADEETTYAVTAKKVEGEENKIELSIYPKISKEGQATIVIPEGKFMVEGKHPTKSATTTFLVKGESGNVESWINDVLGDESEVTVISINGVVIMKDVPASELRTLEPGIYIINGKRVVI
ncbi:MAG: hypothetical protein K2H72_02815, partial [Muribaculaceae bacterium]|nr:hypothetical protein [Muribaculaceae bacterium]